MSVSALPEIAFQGFVHEVGLPRQVVLEGPDDPGGPPSDVAGIDCISILCVSCPPRVPT